MLDRNYDTGTKLEIPYRRTITERLTEEAEGLRNRLKEIEEALTALQSNPDIERILNLVSKVSNGY